MNYYIKLLQKTIVYNTSRVDITLVCEKEAICEITLDLTVYQFYFM